MKISEVMKLALLDESQEIAREYMRENGYKLTEIGKNQAINDLDALDDPDYDQEAINYIKGCLAVLELDDDSEWVIVNRTEVGAPMYLMSHTSSTESWDRLDRAERFETYEDAQEVADALNCLHGEPVKVKKHEAGGDNESKD